MMDDPQVGVVAARVSNLESQVSQIEGRQESTFLGRNENGGPQAAADPGGRVAWTSEWRDDAGKMVAYIPGNALVIDGVNVAVEAQNKQNDEVPLTAGTWYLHIYRHKTNDLWKAEFNQGATGIDDEDWKAKYDIRIVDIHQDGYVEKQYVVGSIVIGKGGVTSLKGEAENSAKIDGDVEITGKSNAADETTSCGIEFLTIAAQPAQQGAAAQPAKIVAKLKNRSASETLWGKHTLSYTGSDGQKHSVEVLGNSDGEIPAVAGEKGDPGEDGEDGYSPTVEVSDVTGGHQVTITDKTGPHQFTVPDGEDGTPAGFGTPTATATELEAGSTPTATVSASGPDTAKVFAFQFGIPKGKDGEDGADGEDGEDGTPAGFGTPTVTATELEAGSTPTATVSASGPDTAKVFAFQFGIPKGKGEQSDWDETDSSADSFIKNKPTLATVATSGDYEDLKNKPTIPKALQGSDYIDIPTTGTDAGKVKAEVPTDGTKGLVTTDTDQDIGSTKTIFGNNHIFCQNSKDDPITRTRLSYSDLRFYYTQEAPYNPGIRFLSGLSATSAIAWIIYDKTTNKISISTPASLGGEGIVLNGGAANKVTLSYSPTIDVSNKTNNSMATCGWVNDNYKVTELVSGNNITITQDATNPKKLTIAATGGATLDHSFSWEGTKKADIAASANIAVDSKTIRGSGGITVTEVNRVITISGSGSQVSGYTTPAGTYDYEVTGQEWDATNHRIVIHKVKKTYENGLLKTREAVTDEYIQFVEETV